MTKSIEVKRITVYYKKKLILDMKQVNSTWKTVYCPSVPKKAKRRSKKGKFASLFRKHKKWLNR